NGKENDEDLEGQDYGFRIYKENLCKFLSVDPLSPKYPWYTPYQFAGNTPIIAIDLDGLEDFWVHTTIDKDGVQTVTTMKDLTDADKTKLEGLFGRLTAFKGGTAYTTETAKEPGKIQADKYEYGAEATVMDIASDKATEMNAKFVRGVSTVTVTGMGLSGKAELLGQGIGGKIETYSTTENNIGIIIEVEVSLVPFSVKLQDFAQTVTSKETGKNSTKFGTPILQKLSETMATLETSFEAAVYVYGKTGEIPTKSKATSKSTVEASATIPIGASRSLKGDVSVDDKGNKTAKVGVSVGLATPAGSSVRKPQEKNSRYAGKVSGGQKYGGRYVSGTVSIPTGG
ncbi:MAG: hypothetical protein EAZ97_02610, partial [Bacteroidetes bacterium]